jgi:hypothetical protein
MNFKKSSSREEGKSNSSGVTKKVMGKGFGMVACRSVVGARNRIQNPPWQRRQNFIAQIIGWGKPGPNHKMETTRRIPTHCHLR